MKLIALAFILLAPNAWANSSAVGDWVCIVRSNITTGDPRPAAIPSTVGRAESKRTDRRAVFSGLRRRPANGTQGLGARASGPRAGGTPALPGTINQ